MARENRRNRDKRQIKLEVESQLSTIAQNATMDPAAQVTTIETTYESMSHHSGPLPSPETLAEYDRIMPGLAGQIVSEASKEAIHRREFNSKALDATIADGIAARTIETRGQYFGFTLAMVVILCGAGLIYVGHEKSGATLAGGTVVGLTSLFVYGRQNQKSAATGVDDKGTKRTTSEMTKPNDD